MPAFQQRVSGRQVDAHAVSVKTRRSIQYVIEKYGLDKDQLRKTGLIDRIVKGYIHAHENNIQLGWVHGMPEPDAKHFYITCDVVSRPSIPKTRPDSNRRWVGAYPLCAHYEGDGNGNFYLENVGGEDEFYAGRRHNKMSAHTCKDLIFQNSIKNIPTACYHMGTMWCYITPKMNDACEEGNVKFYGELDVDEGLLSLYKELEKHDLKAWQKLNVLYAYVNKDLKMWRSDSAFLDSVAEYLKMPVASWDYVLQ